MEYLKYFENKTSAEGYKTESYFVGYLGEENTVLYSVGGEVIKDGEMVEDEPDPTAGFVDLGLSVMWASCNLGASSPEEVGNYYRFGDPQGYTKNDDVFGSGTGYTGGSGDWDITVDPVFINSEIPDKDILSPHVPSASEIIELVNNTVQTLETVNGISGIRFTATNGNSIFMPTGGIIQSTTSYLVRYFLYWSKTQTSAWASGALVVGSLYAAPGETASYNSEANAYNGLPVRGVCYNAPKHTVLKYDEPVQLVKGDNYFTLMRDEISSSTFTATTVKPISIAGLDDLTDETLNTIHTEKSFNTNGDCSELSLTRLEMNQHSSKQLRLLPKPLTGNKGLYQYVKITCEENCTLSMTRWDLSGYEEKKFEATALIKDGQKFRVEATSPNVYYRLYYNDWKGSDLEIKWSTSTRLKVYISDTCDYFWTSSADDPAIVQYNSIQAKGTQLHDAATVDSWANRVDADGYLYVRFNAGRAGYVTFTSIKPTTT